MCICPFHDDKNPSMKVDRRFHCFGCLADGDVIDFTARLFQLTPLNAAKKLACDFGIDERLCSTDNRSDIPIGKVATEKQLLSHALNDLYEELRDELNRMYDLRDRYAPVHTEEEWDPRFVEAIKAISIMENKMDILLSNEEDEKELLIIQRMQETEDGMKEKDIKAPVYYESSVYAREHDQLTEFRNSHWTNCACKNEIEVSIAHCFDGMHLKDDCVKEMLDKYGIERVQVILAATVQLKEWDGRFSRSNKEWANTIRVPESLGSSGWDRRNEYAVNTHPAVLDGYISMVRKAVQEIDKEHVHDSAQSFQSDKHKSMKHSKDEQER